MSSSFPKTPTRRHWYILGVALSFGGAGLLWSVQPMAARILLPRYGGSAAVWTTSLAFFQVALLVGYLIAYSLHRSPIRVRPAFLITLIITIVLSGFGLNASNSPPRLESPVLSILYELMCTVGLPYILLATTASIVPALIGGDDDRAYRLFGWSNAGSMLGLLSYPFFIEPYWPLSEQLRFWDVGFCLWGVAMIALVLRVSPAPVPKDQTLSSWTKHAQWVGLSAIGVALLMAVSDAIMTDLTVTPLFWVVPLALYLLSFVICFGRPRWASSRVWIISFLLSLMAVCYLILNGWRVSWFIQLMGWSSVLFTGCMVCHGNLMRTRPNASNLPTYYLDIAIGGVIGGILCSIVAPSIFSLRAELQCVLPIVGFIGLKTWLKDRKSRSPFSTLSVDKAVGFLSIAILTAVLSMQVYRRVKGQTLLKRNFYGALQIKTYDSPRHKGGIVHLLDGRISHGFQYRGADYQQQPTTYFVPESGVGRLLHQGTSPRSVGIMGLGIGTMASYARPGDTFDFFEINPNVIDVAQESFGFLSGCEGRVRVHLGDGRLMVQNWSGNPFDAIIIDAFTGDAIPAHLITQEAFETYQTKLKKNGFIAVNVSNQHADLKKVIAGHLNHFSLVAKFVRWKAPSVLGAYISHWVIIANRADDLASIGMNATDWSSVQPVYWRDDYAPLLPILR